MQDDFSNNINKILDNVREIKRLKENINQLKNGKLKPLGNKGQSAKELQDKINSLLQDIEKNNSEFFSKLGIDESSIPAPPKLIFKDNAKKEIIKSSLKEEIIPKKALFDETPEPKKIQEIKSVDLKIFSLLSKNEKKEYLKELNINSKELKEFMRLQKKGKKEVILAKKDYSIYTPNQWGELANKFFKKTAFNLYKSHPNFFKPMLDQFLKVEVNMLSRTYISLMLFFTMIALPLFLVFWVLLNLIFGLPWAVIPVIAILSTILTFLGFYFYPSSLTGARSEKIKNELPFALVHMSAVAGSGAQPISIFELVADSNEYIELRKEVKRILNYVNLFGYSLTTSLKNVSNTTPSREFKELLNGMISTIETGGDLKDYLKGKSEEALNTYKLERKKQIEALATYSEVYTAILIAAPLLLIVVLAIINAIGGQLGGISTSILAWTGVGILLPLLNIGFMVFVNAQQKGI